MLMILARLVRSESSSGRSSRFAPRTPARSLGTLDLLQCVSLSHHYRPAICAKRSDIEKVTHIKAINL